MAVTSLAPQFAAALDLMADVTLHPTFPAAEIERQRASRLATLISQKSNPAATVGRVMSAALFGPGHPYGYTELGTEASNKSMSREAMLGFWQQRLVPGNAALVVVGAVSRKELEAMATKAFSGWTGTAPARGTMAAPQGTAAKLVVVDAPGAAQTQLRVASLGVARATPDYEAIEVMNTILGGLFTSRINLNLREDKGYTYGALSAFVMRRNPGPFFVAAGVRTDATAPAVKEMLNEIRKMKESPVSDGGARPGQGQPRPIPAGSFRNVGPGRRQLRGRCSSTTSGSTTTRSTSSGSAPSTRPPCTPPRAGISCPTGCWSWPSGIVRRLKPTW